MAKTKQHVQFSKKMVVTVVASMIALCAMTILLSCVGWETTAAVEVVKAYGQFAIVVFAAYSGNSAVEKWLIFTAKSKNTDTEDESSSNG